MVAQRGRQQLLIYLCPYRPRCAAQIACHETFTVPDWGAFRKGRRPAGIARPLIRVARERSTAASGDYVFDRAMDKCQRVASSIGC